MVAWGNFRGENVQGKCAIAVLAYDVVVLGQISFIAVVIARRATMLRPYYDELLAVLYMAVLPVRWDRA